MKCREFSPRSHEAHEALFPNVIVMTGDISPIFVRFVPSW
jgi:hypothetical protein